jgi:hypothetical protein
VSVRMAVLYLLLGGLAPSASHDGHDESREDQA